MCSWGLELIGHFPASHGAGRKLTPFPSAIKAAWPELPCWSRWRRVDGEEKKQRGAQAVQYWSNCQATNVDGEATKVEIWLSLLDSTSGFKYNYKREHQNDDWESRNAFTWCFDTQKTGDCTNRNYDFNRNTLTIDAKHEQICDRGSWLFTQERTLRYVPLFSYCSKRSVKTICSTEIAVLF